jgi:predicted transposase YbfD/YdcC
MAKTQHVGLDEIVGYFDELEDPRSSVNQKHPLVSVVVIAMMAVLAGAGGPTAIAKWAAVKSEFLLKVLALPNGVPRKDVFRRVLSLLKPEAFQTCFVTWLQALRAQAEEATGVDKPIFAIDGKTSRRSHDHSKGLGALHSVTVWASEFGLSLGQVACAEKSNEITAIPELLQLVDIQGAIITIDAMGTQKTIAAQIIKRDADYVLALKGNQEKLHQAVIAYFGKHLQSDFAGVDMRQHETTEEAHGRTDRRIYTQVPVPQDFAEKEAWAGLKTLGMVVRHYQKDGKEAVDVRYYISSLPMGVKQFARAVREHWGIENSCHWILDMTFREDESRIREPHVRENFAWLNRFVLSLLKQHPGKDSIAMKRRGCGWSDDFLLEVFTGPTN